MRLWAVLSCSPRVALSDVGVSTGVFSASIGLFGGECNARITEAKGDDRRKGATSVADTPLSAG